MTVITIASKEMDELAGKHGDGIFKATHKEVEDKIGKIIVVNDLKQYA